MTRRARLRGPRGGLTDRGSCLQSVDRKRGLPPCPRRRTPVRKSPARPPRFPPRQARAHRTASRADECRRPAQARRRRGTARRPPHPVGHDGTFWGACLPLWPGRAACSASALPAMVSRPWSPARAQSRTTPMTSPQPSGRPAADGRPWSACPSAAWRRGSSPCATWMPSRLSSLAAAAAISPKRCGPCCASAALTPSATAWRPCSSRPRAPVHGGLPGPPRGGPGSRPPTVPEATISRAIPEARFTLLPNAPHMMQIECPEPYAAAVSGFLLGAAG
jgi:pimeloyl-ACP methyl ester carboxylesterase